MSIEFQLDGPVAVVTLARSEKFNAVTQELSDGLVDAIARAGEEAAVLVITGAGKAFCAGADLGDLMHDYESGGPDLARVISARFNPMVHALEEAQVPTIAAINGVAAGAGLGLALACDLRVMSTSAFFMSAFIGLALIPDTGSTWALVQHLGLSRAMELTMSNRRLSAEEAEALGLAHRLAAPDKLMDEALSWAKELAAGPTAAYVANRRLLRAAATSNLAEALSREARTQGELGRSSLHLEGMRAFLEKRPTDFHKAAQVQDQAETR
jgi:2-(1,2-epoxy-1,2-dihydrophenyl)acetyl-CoA isomerase